MCSWSGANASSKPPTARAAAAVRIPIPQTSSGTCSNTPAAKLCLTPPLIGETAIACSPCSGPRGTTWTNCSRSPPKILWTSSSRSPIPAGGDSKGGVCAPSIRDTLGDHHWTHRRSQRLFNLSSDPGTLSAERQETGRHRGDDERQLVTHSQELWRRAGENEYISSVVANAGRSGHSQLSAVGQGPLQVGLLRNRCGLRQNGRGTCQGTAAASRRGLCLCALGAGHRLTRQLELVFETLSRDADRGSAVRISRRQGSRARPVCGAGGRSDPSGLIGRRAPRGAGNGREDPHREVTIPAASDAPLLERWRFRMTRVSLSPTYTSRKTASCPDSGLGTAIESQRDIRGRMAGSRHTRALASRRAGSDAPKGWHTPNEPGSWSSTSPTTSRRPAPQRPRATMKTRPPL